MTFDFDAFERVVSSVVAANAEAVDGDARGARVVAPTTDALLDLVGRAVSGMPLLDA